jgi:tripartite-type tricarboxylate transporter receptor subunit TctC
MEDNMLQLLNTGSAAGVLLAVLVGIAHGQDFPTRSITIVVPLPPGGSTDTVTRLMAKKMSENIGQPIVIENKAGGGGIIGAVSVKNAAPNGYTLYVGEVGVLSINRHMHSNLGYDPANDFEPITTMHSFSHFLMVPGSSSVKTFQDLLALGKSKPGGLSYVSAGPGTISHLQPEIMKLQTGAPLFHVPMKGAAPALAEVASGRADMLFISYLSAKAFVSDGRLRILGIAANSRSKLMPDIPTLAELGLQDVDFEQWFGILAPAKTPQVVIRKLNQEITRAMHSPDVEKVVNQLLAGVITSAPEEFSRRIAADSARFQKIVQQMGIKFD